MVVDGRGSSRVFRRDWRGLGRPDRIHADIGADIDQNVTLGKATDPFDGLRLFGEEGLDPPRGGPVGRAVDHFVFAPRDGENGRDALVFLEGKLGGHVHLDGWREAAYHSVAVLSAG